MYVDERVEESEKGVGSWVTISDCSLGTELGCGSALVSS